MECPICHINYSGGIFGLEPCPNGHTFWEQVAYVDSLMKGDSNANSS